MLTNNYESVVSSFYLAYFGRPADPAGLSFWSQQLEKADGDLSVIAKGFAASVEATQFGGVDVAARVATIYQQLFNREPEAAGLKFWTEAVEQGHITLDELGMNILKGGEGSDVTISTLRLHAAAEFTTAVADTGIKFDGNAAAEASRALIAAVSADTSKESIAAMVKAAGRLVDVAHDTPAVIDALGAGGKLVPLFATARGKAEPANLLQALADLGKTASGDSSTLDSLLRGGSMNKVLEVMPKQATLHDVVDALGIGGLPAAVQVVYPSAPPVQAEPAPAPVETVPSPTPAEPVPTPAEPVPTPTDPAPTPTEPAPTPKPVKPIPAPVVDIDAPVVQHIVAGPNDGALATNENIDLLVSFDASVVVTGSAAIKLANGGSAVYTGGSGTDTLTFKYVPAAGQSTALLKLASVGAFDGSITDLAGNALPASALDGLALDGAVAVDTDAPAQPIMIVAIKQADALGSDQNIESPLATNLATTRVVAGLLAPLADGEHVEYSLDNGRIWSVENMLFDRNLVAVDKVDTTGNPTLMLRVVDAAGNAGPVASRAIVHDAVAPDAGTLAFLKVTESATDVQHDNATNLTTVSATFSHAGAWPADGERLQYSTDGFTWRSEGLQLDRDNGIVTIDGIDLSLGRMNGDGNRLTTLSVRAVDAAGNVTPVASHDLVFDDHVGTPSLALDTDSAGKYGSATDNITNAGAYHAVGIEAGGHAQYSLSGTGGWSETAPEALEGPNKIYVRQVDGAGNVSEATALEFTLDTSVPAAPTIKLALDSGASPTDNITRVGQVVVEGLDSDSRSAWAYSLDGGDTWQRGGAPNAGQAILDVSGDGGHAVRVRQYDAAGNASTDATLDFTLDTKAALLVFDHVQGYTTDVNVTGLAKANVVFGYEGRVDAADKVEYQVDGGGWQSVGANAVDSGTSTITLWDMDLSGADPKVELRVLDAAGNQSNIASIDIDGPYSAAPPLTVTPKLQGLMVSSPADGGIELAVSSTVNSVYTDDGGGAVAGLTVLVGAQSTVVGGIVQVVPGSGAPLQDASQAYYTLGTDENDSFLGRNYVWGFGGNDTFEGTGDDDVFYTGDGVNQVGAGAGADKIDISLGRNTLNYKVGDSSVNGGMDVVTFAGTASANQQVQTFHFDTPPATSHRIDNVVNPADASNAALVAALNAAYQAKADHQSMQAVLVGFQNHDTYLVVDTGDGTIDGSNDIVIKLVGYVPDPYVMAGDVIFGAAP